MTVITLIGIFGNSPFDRSMENELNRYLDSLDEEEENDNEPDPDEKYDNRRLQEESDKINIE